MYKLVNVSKPKMDLSGAMPTKEDNVVAVASTSNAIYLEKFLFKLFFPLDRFQVVYY